MEEVNKNLSPSDRYELIRRLIEEIKLRKYSYQTGKAYILITERFLESGKILRGFLLDYSGKTRSIMRAVYFA